jgi:pre-mRNA-splicing factor ISY1
MARNSEKAQSMLNRYLAGKKEEKTGPRQKRPYLASECRDLNEADKWRQTILRDIGKKVMEIQNAGLGEHRWGSRPMHASMQACAGGRRPC